MNILLHCMFILIVNLLYFMPRAFEFIYGVNGLVLFHASVAFNKQYSPNIVCFTNLLGKNNSNNKK